MRTEVSSDHCSGRHQRMAEQVRLERAAAQELGLRKELAAEGRTTSPSLCPSLGSWMLAPPGENPPALQEWCPEESSELAGSSGLMTQALV